MLCKDCEIFRFPGLAPKCTTTEGYTLPSASSSSTVTAIDETSADSCEHSKLIVNELLFFVFNKYDNNCKTAIQSTILDFYREDEIMAAKQVILQNVDNSLMSVIQPHSRKRIGDNKVDRTVEDILGIVASIDENDSRHLLPTFCASSLSRIPVMPDDMSDLTAIRSELHDLRRQFHNLMSTVEIAVKGAQVVQHLRYLCRLRSSRQAASVIQMM